MDDVTVSLITTWSAYNEMCGALRKADVVAIDTESTGLHMHQEDVIRGISVAFRRGTGNIYSFYVPLSHPNSQNFEPRQLLAALKAVPLHIFHHAIFDWGALAQVGYERNRNFYDTQVGNWLLDENLPTGLKPTAARLWGENEAEEQAHLKALMKPPALSLLADELWSVALLGGVRLTKKRALEMARESQEILHVPKTWATFTAEDIGVYAAKDTELTLRLYDYQLSRTSEVARPDVIYRPAMERELAFQWVLYGMIAAGVRVDVDKMRGQRVAAEARKEEIEAAIGSEVVDIGGQETAVNLRSSRHLAALVYDNWGLECFEHTGSGARSVARSALEPHETHEGVAAILEHKRLAKALSAFYEPLIERVGPGGRVRGHFSSTRTVTGRLACVSDDTLIEMPRNLVAYPNGVPITEVRAGDWVYAFNWRRDLVLRQVKWVGKTGTKETVLVTVENSEGHRRYLRCTPDHLVRLRNGDWRAAGSLLRRHGDPRCSRPPRVMTMVRRAINEDGYPYFFPHSVMRGNGCGSGGRNREHRWVAGQVRGKAVSTKADVHHIDQNRANNHPANLQVLTIAEHRGRKSHHGGQRVEAPDIYVGPTDYIVISVEPYGVEDVWDMEVEEVHNFIANGICVHNSSDPNLQTIPRETTIAGIRECFVPAEGKELWGFDLDQAELRVIAAISKETAMSEPILAGRSIHSETAASVFGPDYTTEQRVLAKGLNFGFCVGLGTRVLTDDFRWVPAETLQEGDGLLAFDEHGPRQWRHGEVTATAIRELPGREIELEDGTVLFATLDHKWLVSGKYGGPRWCTTRHLRPTLTKFLRYLTPWEPDLSYDGGWLAGMFDGEGSLGRGGPTNRQCCLSLSQKDGPIARRVIDLLEQRGFDVAVYDREDSVLRIHVKGGFPEAVRAMGTLRPQRLMNKVYTRDLPRLQARTGTQRVGIRRAGPVEVRPVVVLTTSTATFFAEGFGAHNCYGIQAKKFAASLAAGPPRVPVTMCDYWRAFDWEERRKMRQCRECLVCRADSILKGYERTYPRLVSMMNYLKDRAKDRGYIPLHIKGRWRHFRSPGNRYPRYYSAMNGVVQGGIAEVMKSVMLRLGEVPDATLCLQVHDELVMEVAPGEADRVQEQLSGILREVNPFSVELVFTKKQWGV